MPTEENVTRKLRAIMSADVKGYSLLMADDESFTVKTLKSYRKVMSAQIVRHKGRVVDTPGDNLLSEFASVVDAVQCAVEIQKILKERNDTLPANKRLEFRIGVNIGDVIQDGDSLYGEGVNIAARIEGLSDAGGVCISRNAYDHIRNKLNYGYEYLGERTAKNIKIPVRVYKVLIAPEDAGKLIGDTQKPVIKNWLWVSIVMIAIVVTSLVWLSYTSRKSVPPASVDNMMYPLPDKPSIAVLPFDNLSGDINQEYIADGISENMITALSKYPNLFVIARNSSFTYKGTPVKVQQVSEELGVRYVLEGSVQKSGDNIRVNAQLIDAIKGHHIWAEKYDRQFKDIFVLQDDIILNILKELQIELTGLGRETGKGTDNPEAYLNFIKGLYYYKRFTKDDNAQARELFKKAITLDPTYTSASAMVGVTYYTDIWSFYSENVKESVSKTAEWAEKTLSLDDSDPGGLYLMSVVYKLTGQMDKAIATGDRAIKLAPNSADILVGQVDTLRVVDRTEEALKLMQRAMRINPKPTPAYYWMLGSLYHTMGRYEEAIISYQPIFNQKSEYMSFIGRVGMAFAYLELNQKAEARIQAKEALKLRPKADFVGWAAALLRYKDMKHIKHLVKPLDSLLYPDSDKHEVYINEDTPYFKFDYPESSNKYTQNLIFPEAVITLITPRSQYIAAVVMDIPESLQLAECGPKYYVDRLKQSGTASNINIISNIPFTLKDGTEAYKTEIEYTYATAAWEVGVIIISVYRDNKFVNINLTTTAGEQSELAWIPESLTFE